MSTPAAVVQTPPPGYSCLTSGYRKALVKPGAMVWSGPMPEERAEQVAFFQREGFFILRGLLNQGEVAELDAEVKRMAREHEKLPRIREGFDLEPQQDATRNSPTFRKIGGITDMSAAFNRLMRQPRVTSLLADVIGPALSMYRDVVMMKPARVGREKPWHRDSVYFPYKPKNLVSVMTALDAATPENGCLQVVPRSHRIEQEFEHHGGDGILKLEDSLQWQSVYLPLQAGDAVAFHSQLLHASEPNTSQQDRRVAIITYMNPALQYTGKDAPETCVKVAE